AILGNTLITQPAEPVPNTLITKATEAGSNTESTVLALHHDVAEQSTTPVLSSEAQSQPIEINPKTSAPTESFPNTLDLQTVARDMSLSSEEETAAHEIAPGKTQRLSQQFSEHYQECFKREMMKMIIKRALNNPNWIGSCQR